MSLTNAVLTKIETTNVNAEDIDMTKNIRLLRQIFGRTRRDISPLAFSVAVNVNEYLSHVTANI